MCYLVSPTIRSYMLLCLFIISVKFSPSEDVNVSISPGLDYIFILVGPYPSHASFVVWSSHPHLRGESSPLGINVTIPGYLNC